MTVTIYDIIQSNKIFNKIIKSEFSGKQSFIIARLMKILSNELESFYEIRKKLIEKYAEKNEETGEYVIVENMVKIKEDSKEIFQKEIEDLLKTSVEINSDYIEIDWLEHVKLTPQEILILEPFIKI